MCARPSRRTFRDRLNDMTAALKREIAAGIYPPGSFLPSEEQLVARFGLSNNSVRKGLEALLEQGLIEKLPRVGTRVLKTPPDMRTTIRLGCPDTMSRDALLDRLLELFHECHPGIRVKPVTIRQSMVRPFMEDGMLDAVVLNYPNFEELNRLKLLHLLEPVPVQPDIYPFLNKRFAAEGALYARPFLFSPVILCYNKDHFREKGVLEPDSSWTWDDLLAQTALLAGEGRRGLYFDFLNENRWLVFLLQSGGKLERDDTGAVRLRGSGLLEALGYCRSIVSDSLIFAHFQAESAEDAHRLFLEGRVSVMMTSYFGLNLLKDTPFSFDICPVPGRVTPRTLLIALGLAVHRQSPHKEAALALTAFLASEQAQRVIREGTFSLPSVKPVAESEGSAEGGGKFRFDLYRDIMPTFATHTDLNMSGREVELLRNELKLFWFHLIDEEALCRRLEALL